MKTILLLIFISLLSSVPVASSVNDADDAAIQGVWYLSGQVTDKNGQPGLSWFLEWRARGLSLAARERNSIS